MRTVLLTSLVTLAVSGAPVRATAQTPPPATQLLTGEQKVLEPGFAIGNIAVANPQVCDFTVLPERTTVLLIAVGEGHTLLTLWDQQGRKRTEIGIDVVSRELMKLKDDLAAVLRPYRDVQIRTLGSRITLTGMVDTLAQLQEVQAVAEAAQGNVSSIVRSREKPKTDEPIVVTIPATVPDAPLPPVGAAPAPRPAPPPPVALPPGTLVPVPLSATKGGAATATPTPPSIAEPPATAVGAEARPSTPDVRSASAPRLEYVLELIQSSTGAPPPDVVAPQGQRLFSARLSVSLGATVRQLLTVGSAGIQAGTPSNAGAGLVGLSVRLKPTLDDSGAVQTHLIVDTNLPIGGAVPGVPRWRRAQFDFQGDAGETHYVTEQELAEGFAQMAPAADVPVSNGPGAGAVVGGVLQTAAGVMPSAVPGGEYVQAVAGLSSLFAGRGPSGPAREAPKVVASNAPVLVIAITPFRTLPPPPHREP